MLPCLGCLTIAFYDRSYDPRSYSWMPMAHSDEWLIAASGQPTSDLDSSASNSLDGKGITPPATMRRRVEGVGQGRGRTKVSRVQL